MVITKAWAEYPPYPVKHTIYVFRWGISSLGHHLSKTEAIRDWQRYQHQNFYPPVRATFPRGQTYLWKGVVFDLPVLHDLPKCERQSQSLPLMEHAKTLAVEQSLSDCLVS